MTTLPPEANDGQGADEAAQAPTPPPAAPQYEAPPAGAEQAAPQYQAAPAGATDPVGNIQLNYWLSVFFTWIPALIFWLIEKDKGNQRATAFHVANFNFSLVRTALYVVVIVGAFIPYLNLILVPLVWIAQLVMFVFHIMAAAKVADAYRNNGKTDPFIFNIPFVK